MQELIAYAKDKPGKLSYGSGGPGSPHHLYAELLASMTGIKMTHVPTSGTLPALNDVVAGHIDFMFSDISPLLGNAVRAARCGRSASRTAARITAFPDMPPLNEAGVPGFDVAGWFMVVTTGQDAAGRSVDKLHRRADDDDGHARHEGADRQAQPAADGDPPVPEMQEFVKSEIVRWGNIVEQGRDRRIAIDKSTTATLGGNHD